MTEETKKRIIEMYQNGERLLTIEKETGYEDGTITKLLKKEGIELRGRGKCITPKIPQEDETRILETYQQYQSVDTVAEKTGISIRKIRQILEENGIGGRHGNHFFKEIPEEDRKAIINLYHSGKGRDPIQKETGYGRRIIDRVLKEEKIERRAGNEGNLKYEQPIDPELKTCSMCGETKSIDDFGKNINLKSGVSGICKKCKSKYSRPKNLRRNFGITETDYEKIFLEQKGLCAACNQPETSTRNGIIKRLAVDHNHQTNKLRQLLCQRCNVIIGMIEEDINVAEKIINYLKKHKE